MRPRWRKVIADLWGNFTRFILVVLSLTIGLFSVGMIVGGYVSILDDMETGYQSIHPADLRVRTDDFDEELIERVRRVDGVTGVDGEKRLEVQVMNGDGEWQNITIRVIPEDGQRINQILLLEGTMPEDQQIILDVHRDLGVDIGDSVFVQLPSGKQRELTITGSVLDQTIGVVGSSYFIEPIYGYITFETLPWFQEDLTYETLLVTVDPSLTADEIDGVEEEITRLVEQGDRTVYSVTDLSANEHPNSGYVQALAGLLALLGFLSVFLSGFLVFNAMTALFTQQVQYIGIMKAIGAQRKTIIIMYVAFIVVFSLIAMGIAIPTSSWAWARMGEFFSARLNYTSGETHYIPLAVAAQVVIGLLLPQAAGILPVLRSSKISVREAITSTGIKSGDFKKGWLDRKLERFKGIGRPLMISLRNTFRRKGRLILTLITLSLGGAVFISTFNVRASLETYIDKVSKYILADISLEFDRYYRINEIQDFVMSIEGVESVEPRSGAACQLLNDIGEAAESVEMLGAPADSALIRPILLEGRWIILGDRNAIVLNEAFLTRYPELDVGDSITLYVNRREVDWTVVGFFQFIGRDSFLVYVPLDYLNEITGNSRQAANFQIVSSPEVIKAGLEDELVSRVDDYFRARGYHVTSVSTSDSLRGNATSGLDTLTFFLLIMSGLTAAVGSVGLTGTMGMNVMERTREIGVMRAIGATDRQVMKQVIIEGVFIGLISWVFAFLLAFPLSSIMSNIINLSIFGIATKTTFTAFGFIIWLGIVILLSILASILPARNAARLTIREVLAYE
jgi:putative ABC transport system permease protein